MFILTDGHCVVQPIFLATQYLATSIITQCQFVLSKSCIAQCFSMLYTITVQYSGKGKETNVCLFLVSIARYVHHEELLPVLNMSECKSSYLSIGE